MKSKKAIFPIIALILLDLEFVLRLELNFGRSRMNLGFNDYEFGGVPVGHKIALVDDQPGVTRDLREGNGKLGDIKFTVIDTGPRYKNASTRWD